MRRRFLKLATAALALAGCQQTLHLYASTSDGGGLHASGGNAGMGGRDGTGGFGGNKPFTWDAGGPDQRCPGAPNVLTFTPDTPNVVVALDRSSNMNQSFSNSSDTHLSAAVHALYSDVSTFSVSKFYHPWTIHFSFVDFPNSGTGCTGAAECCAKDAAALTTATFDADTSCDSPSGSCVASANRPIEAALTSADQGLVNSGNNGPRYVVLISDGDPAHQGGCTPDDCISAQKVVSTMFQTDHITLSVVAIDGGRSTACLQDLAMSANGTLHSPSYALASDSLSLGGMIGGAISSTVCSGTLNAPPSPTSSLQVAIFSGNNPTTYTNSAYDGWTFEPNNNRFRLHGSACDAYTENPMGLLVTDGCSPGRNGTP